MMSPLQYSWPYHSHSKHFSQRQTRRHLYYNYMPKNATNNHSATSSWLGSPLRHLLLHLHGKLSILANLEVWKYNLLRPVQAKFEKFEIEEQDHTLLKITCTLGVVLFNSLVTAPSHTLAPPLALHSVWDEMYVFFVNLFVFDKWQN